MNKVNGSSDDGRFNVDNIPGFAIFDINKLLKYPSHPLFLLLESAAACWLIIDKLFKVRADC